jgi:D-threo-aldose 1-dehydrogenase
VASIIPGARSVTEIDQNIDTFTTPIPADLWAELKHEKLLRDDAPTP